MASKSTAGTTTRATASGRGNGRGGWNYPRRGKGPVHRWLPSWRVVLGTVLGLIAVVVGGVGAAYLSIQVPEPEEVALAETTTVYFADGTTPIGTLGEINRTIIDVSELPAYVGEAVVASEDRRFYSNAGVDPQGIARALWNNLRGGKRQGGSTLTQQYVENYLTGRKSGYVDKAKEALLALKVGQTMSKEQILDAYLNTIYFGRGAYGIEAAAQAYFGEKASDLTLSQSAMLAGIIPAPSAWDPAISPEQATKRWNRTLDYMVEEGMITQAERDAQVFPDVVERTQTNRYEGTNGYLLSMAVKELTEGEDAPFTSDELNGGGFDVVTTFDADIQAAAVATVEQDLPADHADNLKATLVSIDPSTGGVVALYGGADYLTEGLNRATQAVYQGGSTFKPFALVAALEEGMPLSTVYPSYTAMDVDGYVVNNYDSRDRGDINLVEATKDSVNSVYVQLNRDISAGGQPGEKLIETAVEAGLPEGTLGLVPVISNVLGNASPHAIDMATVFATYAAQGVRHDTHVVDHVLDREGGIVYEGPTQGERVFSEKVMADATFAMTKVASEGTASQVSELGRPVAGKTGSSNDYKSASFAGYIPQLATVVALYQPAEDGSEEPITPFGGYRPVAGGTVPADMWLSYMERVIDITHWDVVSFPEVTEDLEPVPGSTEPEEIEIPDVAGLSQDDAIAILTDAGFSVFPREEFSDLAVGTVIRTEPSGGTAPWGSGVTIVVSKGPEPAPSPTPEPSTSPTPSPTPEPPAPTPTPTPTPEPDGGGAVVNDGSPE